MKKLLLFFALCCWSKYSIGQTPHWENLFPANRVNITLIKTLDGHLITSGVQHGTNQGLYFPSNFAKYDTAGNLLWQQEGRTMHTGEQDLKQLPNGRFLFAGSIRKNIPANGSDTFLQLMEADGDTATTWAQTFVEPYRDYPTEVVLLDNGGIAIAGLVTSPYAFTLRRTDSLGNTKWYRKFAHSFSTYGTRMIRNRNGNLVLLGMSRPVLAYPWHPYLIVVNQNGQSIDSASVILEDTVTQEATNRIFNNLIQTSDGDYAFGGYFSNNGFIAKTDSAFNLEWYYEMPPQTTTAQEHITSKLVELQDSTLLFLSKDNSPQAPAFYLTRLTKEGQFISTTPIQSQVCPGGNVMPYNWQFLADSSVVICGWCVTNNQAYIGRWGNLNLPLPMGFEQDTTTVSAPEVQLNVRSALGLAFPNPAENTVTLPYKLPAGTKAASIHISELATGRLVKRIMLNPEVEQVKVSLQHVNSGMYSYTLFVEGTPVATKKLVVIK